VADASYGRGQVEWALWRSFARVQYSRSEVPKVFRTRIKALEFGESLVKREQAAAWLAIWIPFALLASAAVLAFRNGAFRPPTGRPDLIDRAASRLVSLRQSWTQSKRRQA